MANLKNIGIAIAVLGLLGAMVAVTADYTGLNLTQPEDSRDEAAFGWVQISGVIGGASLLVIGAVMTFRSGKEPEEGPEDSTEEEEEGSACPTCGASVDADATNCEECGEKFGTETPEVAAEESDASVRSTSHPSNFSAKRSVPLDQGSSRTKGHRESEEPESEEPETEEPSVDEPESEKPESEESTDEIPKSENPMSEVPTREESETEGGEDEEYECPTCGDALEPGAKTCPTCGAVFDESQDAAEPGTS